MKISDFIAELEDILELEEGEIEDENSMIKEFITSLGLLSIVVLCDEFFSKQLTNKQFQSITTVRSLMTLIGMEHFEQ